MALISIIPDFHPLNDQRLLDRAASLKPVLNHRICAPVSALARRGGEEPESIAPERLPQLTLAAGDELCLDFGEHLVGRVTLELDCEGSHQDAPAWLQLKFAEYAGELKESAETYEGWLSRSWIQEQELHADLLPARVALPRRYAFRYLKITVRDTSPKYRLVVRSAICRAESSADRSALRPLHSGDETLDRIHAVCLNTLADCMQEIFEDGPKRDRRLWMGDLRLQALSNYVSFRNNDLVKRCLYLFGGSRFPDGRVSAAVFTEPEPEADDTYLFDYALMFPVALEEYLQETGDGEALADLYDVAMQQIDLALERVGSDGLITAEASRDAFIDWAEEMDKRACAQGVLIYAMDFARRLAGRKRDAAAQERLRERQRELRLAARSAFWDEERGCFRSGDEAAAATQIWMVLADVPSPEQALRAMDGIGSLTDGPRMATPYIHHYYVEALLHTGRKEQAAAQMKRYWGGMLDAGADTFWECWDGVDPDASPYGSSIVNSYCHAWSCTPAYFICRRLARPDDNQG